MIVLALLLASGHPFSIHKASMTDSQSDRRPAVTISQGRATRRLYLQQVVQRLPVEQVDVETQTSGPSGL